MNLSRVRLRLALVFALVSAVSVGVLAFFAIQFGTRQIDDQAERDLQQQVAAVVGRFKADDLPTTQYDTWLVDTRAEAVTKLGETDIEPPLLTLAKDVVRYGPYSEPFSQGSDEYLLYAQPLPGKNKQAIVAASWLGDYQSDADSLRRDIVLASIAVVVFTSLAGYWLSGRALRPARRAMEQQRDFLANAAHELRTPIAVIQASASQALGRSRPSEEYVRTLSEIRGAAERAGTTVADMLDLARLEAGQADLRRSPLRLDLLAEEVAASVEPEVAEVSVIAGEAVVVDADYSLLRQALDNVVQNAVRRARHVELRTAGGRHDAVVEVLDDGPGFDPELLPNVFERWAKGPGRADRHGSGIGLAIVKTIVEAHGGSVDADNRPEGGARIRLHLPRPAS